MDISLEPHLQGVEAPANLRINDQINEFREECRRKGCPRPYHHFAFGQSPFHPPPAVVESLREHAGRHSYLPTAGLPQLREVVADFYRRHFGLTAPGDRVVISPGSKEMLSILMGVLDGPVVVPTPSWVSYLPQARILRKEIQTIGLKPEEGFKLLPDHLDHELRASPAKQHILVLNHPNNPTGVVYDQEEMEALAEVCRKHGTVVISDEIYALTTFDPGGFTSMMNAYPEGTVVTGGLSKDRSAGGYRLGVGVFPEGSDELVRSVLKVAGSTYSCVAAPIQHAALVAYRPDKRVERHMGACRRVNAAVGRTIHGMIREIPGVRTSDPRGGFYLLLDLNDLAPEFQRLGLTRSREVARTLLRVEHTALLPGDALLLQPGDLAFRCSYVDYDGVAALQAWLDAPPEGPEEEGAFVRETCPLLVDGVAYLDRFLAQVRAGAMPRHF